ncbi:MAG: D-2-hydroxyacid dehydrogenase [Oscillibacter sp.]|jgi:phosphoglycerate dehydrogenase-like enzyme|nr:D-2-hydroxyacid dehydrogenase [Oscillibacter sp.]
MSRNICVCQEFLSDAHKRQIEDTAKAAGFSVRFFALEQQAQAAEYLQSCEILYAHSPELLRAAPASLQWYCCSFAGVDPYCKNDGIFKNPACLLTNSSGAYGVTISEHLLMVTIMLLRRMPEYEAIVQNHGWSNQLAVRSIIGSEFTILGTGNIGTTFAQKAKLLGAGKIIGVSRSGKSRDAVYDEMYSFDHLDEILPKTQILVMALPGTPETIGIMTKARIGMLSPASLLINVGRGTAIDQSALVDALNAGQLGGAALDVMTPEPLPKDDPLWSARNLILTPHVSGNMTLGYTCDKTVSMFCEDLENYAAGRPLKHLVDRARGY